VQLLLLAGAFVNAAAQATSFTPGPAPTETSTIKKQTGNEITGGEYYPGGGYDEQDLPSEYTHKEGAGAAGTESNSFMSMPVPAQIGVIVAIVVVAIALFVGAIMFYLHRRRAWEAEVKRKSQMHLPPQKQETTVVERDIEGGQTITYKSEFEHDRPPQTPTWKRWLVQ